jgi:hypothetical protein
VAVDPNLYGFSDDLPLLPTGATPAAPSLAEQQRAHAVATAPVSGGDDSLPLAPAAKPSILNSSWSQLGKTLWDEGTRGVGLGTRATAEGLSSPFTGAADVVTWPMRAIQRGLGIPTDAPSTIAQRGLDATGLPTPQTPAERNTSTIVSGAASALPSLAMGGAPTVANAVRLGVQGGAGALAGQKAQESDFVPPWLKPSVALLAGMAGSKGADVGWNLGTKGVNAVAGNFNDTYNAFKRLGMPTDLVGTVSGGEGARSAEAAGMRMPFASSTVRPVAQGTVDRFGNAVDETANMLDPTRTAVNAQQTGDVLQNSYRDWVANVFGGPQGRQKAAWDPLDQRMAGAAVDQGPFRAALDQAANPPNLASMPATQQAFSSPQARAWLTALNADAPAGTNLTWDQARAIRQRIGDAMGTPDLVGSIGMQNLKNIYAGLAQGLETTAVQHGQGALFNSANAVSTAGHAFMENVGSKISQANNPLQEGISAEQATKNVLNSGDTTLQAIRQELPDAADHLAAYKLRQMQQAKPSVASAYDDTSTGTFLSNAVRMRQNQPGGYSALFNTPDIQQRLDDLQTAAGSLRKTEQHLNTSGTAETLGWMDYLRGIREGISNGTASERAINTAQAVLVPPFAGWAGGHAVTSPALTRYLAARGAGPPPVPPRVAGILGNIPQMVGSGGSADDIPTINVTARRPQ